MDEQKLIQPISADEIKDGIVTKVCEAMYEAMNKTCNLYGCAYPKFKAEGTITLTLDNFGDIRLDVVKFEAGSEGGFHDPRKIDVPVQIPFTPPDKFRKQTGQAVPVAVLNDDGSIEQKAVFYRRERTSRIGRSDAETE